MRLGSKIWFIWFLLALAGFHLAFEIRGLELGIVVFFIALLELNGVDTPRKAFYTGLLLGLLIYSPQLGFFYVIFKLGAVPLWGILSAWLAVFQLISWKALRKFGDVYGSFAVPIFWCAIEYFRSELYYLRFSWLSPGMALSTADWARGWFVWGSYGVGFLLATAAVCMWLGWRAKQGSVVIATLAAGVAMLFLPAAIDRKVETEGRSVSIAGIQFEFAGLAEVLEGLERTRQAAPKAELVVLSEYTFEGPIPERVLRWCRKHQCHLIAGGKESVGQNNFFNTVYVIDPSGNVIFKQGKSVPIQFFRDGLPAPTQEIWNSPWGKIGIAVCYDLSYRRVIDRLVAMGAEALIIPTMDVAEWGKRQHQLHGRMGPMRAREYGLPVFRLCSSGISQIIDANGALLASAPFPGQASIIQGELFLKGSGRIPWDHWLAPACGLLSLIALLHFLVSSRFHVRGKP
ncbi:MAG TPA: nitrilase-related carbon-nitrogen hydrolase [Candidatus Paceibacterota bacterium]|nr:nitrilase-related carbon-nitrogen hydrolase [Verrucomicrobiota bacterium]HRY51055.1 nitrilase-related carbon-nitrogen hydrolase [Candidatus Paceibacterota bacterium]HRZ99446.1 nitrilase-related carbon-nitrogen hydrolase [Candidatus Paceibacterota bacterium]